MNVPRSVAPDPCAPRLEQVVVQEITGGGPQLLCAIVAGATGTQADDGDTRWAPESPLLVHV
jgi:hypothetical protein